MKSLSVVLLAIAAAGCSITQKVTPVGYLEDRAICIIEDPAVRSGFLEEYRKTLIEKGYVITMLPNGSSRSACEVTTTYLARWSWDMALYMSFAEIKVYKHGALKGEALYDSRSGGGRLDKFVNGGAKIRELVEQLFPG